MCPLCPLQNPQRKPTLGDPCIVPCIALNQKQEENKNLKLRKEKKKTNERTDIRYLELQSLLPHFFFYKQQEIASIVHCSPFLPDHFLLIFFLFIFIISETRSPENDLTTVLVTMGDTFFTFQAADDSIGIYRGKRQHSVNLIHFRTMFFPSCFLSTSFIRFLYDLNVISPLFTVDNLSTERDKSQKYHPEEVWHSQGISLDEWLLIFLSLHFITFPLSAELRVISMSRIQRNENSAAHDLHIFLFLFDDSFVWLQHIEVKYDIEHCYEKILPCMERTYCE